MNKTIKLSIMAFGAVILMNGCKDDEKIPQKALKNDIPEFFAAADDDKWGTIAPSIQDISIDQTVINKPNDLDFNPTRPGELWIINEGTENTGGSTVMVTDINGASPKFEYRKDQNSWHFMSLPTGIAFGANGDFGTSTGVLDANHSGGTFTGPTTWSGNLSIYAKPSNGNGSHLDMLHGSPYSMGIAWDKDNAYYVFDGYNQHLAWYDFGQDHGPGGSDHDDGKIRRFMSVGLKKNGKVPSHLVVSEDRKFVYCVDGGNARCLKYELETAKKVGDLALKNEQLAEHSNWDIDYKVISQNALSSYCGIAINGDRLFLSDNETGKIICIDTKTGYVISEIQTGIKGITGLAIWNSQLYFVSYQENSLYKIIAN